MVKRALHPLPTSLDETYDRILSNIDELYSEDAYKILQWLSFSARPMTLAEVTEAIAINIGNGPVINSDKQFLHPKDMLFICSSLITISNSDLGSDENENAGM